MEHQKPNLTKSGWWSVFSPYRMLVIWAICFFGAAGQISILRGWIFVGIALFASLITSVFQLKYLSELSNARGKAQKGTKTWDMILLMGYFLLYLFGNSIVAGLDLGRFGWSSMGWGFLVPGVVLYAITFIIIQWAMLTNRHFEGTVRIQEDRDHQVITVGPYRYIRHPGYAGMVLINIAIPLLIGSVVAFIPASLAIILVVIRTHLEDRTLQAELPGYQSFIEQTRYRLLPGIW